MLIEKGYVAKTKNWTEKHYVPSPKMNELCVAMAKGINVQLNTEIIRIEKKEQGWLLYTKDKQEFGPYEWVINTTPAPQAEKLLPDSFSGHQYFKKCKMFGCYTLMLALSAPWKWEWEAAIVRNSLISWMTLNSNKPDPKKEVETAAKEKTQTQSTPTQSVPAEAPKSDVKVLKAGRKAKSKED